MIESNPNSPTFLFDDLPLDWQMTRCEKYALASLVQVAQPEVAVEVGTFRGGSLQVIARGSRRVYSIDCSAEHREDLARRFSNVEFRTGDSRELLPALLTELGRGGEALGLVLIDGDHSTEGVRADIEAVLDYRPIRPLYLICHDSFNPQCRAGMLAARWQRSEHVHYVEVDFIPGVYHHQAFSTAPPRSMYGGFCVALLKPERRRDPLVVHQSQQGLFESTVPRSVHARWRSLLARLRRRLLG